MPIITTPTEIYFSSIFWGLGHMILGYRFRGLALLSLGIGSIYIVIILAFVKFLNLNYVYVFFVVVLINYVIVYFDLWKQIRKINTQTSNIHNNRNIPSGSPISNNTGMIFCKQCHNENPYGSTFCSNCGTHLINGGSTK